MQHIVRGPAHPPVLGSPRQNQDTWGDDRDRQKRDQASPRVIQPSGYDTLSSYVEHQLGKYGEKAKSLETEEERRGKSMEDYLRAASEAANKPTITEEEINRRFSGRADIAGDKFLDQMGSLREYMGASGVSGGGFTSGVAANAAIERLGQLTQARGDLMSFKATSDALDAQRAFDRATKVGEAINRPVSMLGVDFENQALLTRLSQLGIEVNREGNKEAAAATRAAGQDAKTGAIAGSGLGLLGGLK